MCKFLQKKRCFQLSINCPLEYSFYYVFECECIKFNIMKLLIVLCVLIDLVVGSVLLQHETRVKREWNFFRETTTVKPTTTTVRTLFPGNDLSIGECKSDDKVS